MFIGYGEHAGSGVPDIFKAWRDEGLNEPVVEEVFGGGVPDRTILTLPLKSADLPIIKSSDSADIKDRHRQILAVLDENIEYSAEEIAERIGLKGSRTRQLLKEMLDSKIITAVGSTNGKRYMKK